MNATPCPTSYHSTIAVRLYFMLQQTIRRLLSDNTDAASPCHHGHLRLFISSWVTAQPAEILKTDVASETCDSCVLPDIVDNTQGQIFAHFHGIETLCVHNAQSCQISQAQSIRT